MGAEHHSTETVAVSAEGAPGVEKPEMDRSVVPIERIVVGYVLVNCHERAYPLQLSEEPSWMGR